MPLYEYHCDACGGRFEIIQKFSDAPPDACRLCGKGPVQRLASSPAIQFKGTGWYVTDYAQKGKSDPSAPAKTESAKTDGDKTAGGKTEGTKTDSAKSESTKGDSGAAGTSGSSKTDSAAPASTAGGTAASTPSKE